MANNEFDEFISRGLPNDSKFAHKWDVDLETNVFSDLGIVYIGNKTFLFSIMVKSKNPDINSSKEKVMQFMENATKQTFELTQNN